jgi:hypothetical protein
MVEYLASEETKRMTTDLCAFCGVELQLDENSKPVREHTRIMHLCPAIPETWDMLKEQGKDPGRPRPFGPNKRGSTYCRSGSIASGGKREYCTCDTCF